MGCPVNPNEADFFCLVA